MKSQLGCTVFRGGHEDWQDVQPTYFSNAHKPSSGTEMILQAQLWETWADQGN